MLVPTLPGWKVETVGDDICWMKPGPDGRLYAINPEAGFFGVAPGTNMETNPNAMYTGRGEHHLHQHRAHCRRRRVVGGNGRAARGTHRLEGPALEQGPRHTRGAPELSLHRARPARTPRSPPSGRTPRACPSTRSSSVVGARASIPLVFQSRDWDHGVFLGSIMASETTAAAAGAVGNLRRDPFAMLPFCGYNMADYFGHWLTFSERFDEEKLPKIFYVNWFRKSDDGRWLWPGFGENSRVLEWIFERTAGRGEAVETAIGFVPTPSAINVEGLNVTTGRHGRTTERRR